MATPIRGRVAKILDDYRLIANIGHNRDVEKSMKFRVFAEIKVRNPGTNEVIETYEHDKAVVVPKEIYDSITLMETETQISQTSISQRLSRFSDMGMIDFSAKIPVRNQEKLNTPDDVPEDIEVVQENDVVQQIIEQEDSTPSDRGQQDDLPGLNERGTES